MAEHWSEEIVKKVVERFSQQRVYTCASGISPSGRVHAGNFRDLITSDAVYRSFVTGGYNARFILSWDDFDRFRKVPSNVPESFREHLGKPLSDVPDPLGEYKSYGERFAVEFEASLRTLGIIPEILHQSAEYRSGRYESLIRDALLQRQKIAKVLSRFKTNKMTPQEMEGYYPVNIYSRFTGKDNTKVLDFDGENVVKYICKDTGKVDEIDFTRDRNIKLPWKVDWPMRWKAEGVSFEPGGRDHASFGGSYDVSSAIAREVLGIMPPFFQGYDFIGMRGLKGKMSSSTGNVITTQELLEIYEPALVRWLYLKFKPEQAFDFAFDSDVFRIYGEFDRTVEKLLSGKIDKEAAALLELSRPYVESSFSRKPIPFRQLAGYAQVVQFDRSKLEMLLREVGEEYDSRSLDSRLPRVKKWLENYNPEDRIKLRDEPDKEYLTSLPKSERAQLDSLRTILESGKEIPLAELEGAVYAIPKDVRLSDLENKKRQRDFFKMVYKALLGRETGPRLPTFLWAGEKSKIIKLLKNN